MPTFLPWPEACKARELGYSGDKGLVDDQIKREMPEPVKKEGKEMRLRGLPFLDVKTRGGKEGVKEGQSFRRDRAQGPAQKDSVHISSKAKESFLKEGQVARPAGRLGHEAKAKEEELRDLLAKKEDFKRALEELEKAKGGEEGPLEILIKCLKIARRIMKGDKVASQDQTFLAEHEPELYAKALMLRRNNDQPKDHDSLLEEEENPGADRARQSLDRALAGSQMSAEVEAEVEREAEGDLE